MQLLLERLADAGHTLGLAEAVRQQVQRLVGVHIWEGDAGLHLMDHGIAPLADVHSSEQLGQLAARLHALIQRHEPRLAVQRVDVDAPSGDWRLARLLVIGRLLGETELRTLSFEMPRQ